MSIPASLCVFRLASGALAIDATLVGEVAVLDEVTPLPGCHPAVRGIANLRGRPIAVVDLDLALGGRPGPARAEATVLVARLPGREAGLLVERVEGVFAADPADRRAVNRLAEPAWISAFQTFPGGTTAAVIDPDELGARLDALRPARRN